MWLEVIASAFHQWHSVGFLSGPSLLKEKMPMKMPRGQIKWRSWLHMAFWTNAPPKVRSISTWKAFWSLMISGFPSYRKQLIKLLLKMFLLKIKWKVYFAIDFEVVLCFCYFIFVSFMNLFETEWPIIYKNK